MNMETLGVVVAVVVAVSGIVYNWYNAHKNASKEHAEQTGANSSMTTEMKFIANDIKEIKADIKELRNNEKVLAEHEYRITALERGLEK